MIPSPDSRDGAGLVVLHVVAKFSSGVGTAIAQYTRALPGAEHHLLSVTAVDAEGDLADQADFRSTVRMPRGVLAARRAVRARVRDLRPDVVHAHSSHGGGYARLAVGRRRVRMVYTPHCFAFERTDVGRAMRAAFWVTEALLATNTTVVAGCSPREVALARRLWGTATALVPNVVPDRGDRQHRPDDEPVVLGGGRLCAQKDPDTFLRVVEEIRRSMPGVRAVWLGDGDADRRARLEAGGVHVTGWVTQHEVLDHLARAGAYLHTALWEGFPLMVAEAAATGTPTFVRRRPSFDDVPPSLAVADGDLAAAVQAVLTDSSAAAANRAAWQHQVRGHTTEQQRVGLVAAYTGVTAVAVVADR